MQKHPQIGKVRFLSKSKHYRRILLVPLRTKVDLEEDLKETLKTKKSHQKEEDLKETGYRRKKLRKKRAGQTRRSVKRHCKSKKGTR